MRIALAIRGLIRRPGSKSINAYDQKSVDWCSNNIAKLKAIFRQHDVTTYFCSWDVDNSRAMVYHKVFDNSILLKQPTVDDAFRILPIEPIWFRDPSSCHHHTPALYGAFTQSKAIMSTIDASAEDFDYICATRPDLSFEVVNINEWMKPNTFVVPGVNFVNFNDHFGVAPKNEMIKIYTPTYETLKETVQNSLDTESVLKNLIAKIGLNVEMNFNITEYQLRDVNHLYLYKRDCGLL